MAAELLLQRRRPGDELEAKAIVDHGEPAEGEREALPVSPGDIFTRRGSAKRPAGLDGELLAKRLHLTAARRNDQVAREGISHAGRSGLRTLRSDQFRRRQDPLDVGALPHGSGTPVEDLPGLDWLLSKNELSVPKNISRAVLVGTSCGPQDVISLEGGRKIRTTWGELAWQLCGPEVFEMTAENDARGIAPGSHLLEAILKKCAPCLILIDEWVAYLRQIYKVGRGSDASEGTSRRANTCFTRGALTTSTLS